MKKIVGFLIFVCAMMSLVSSCGDEPYEPCKFPSTPNPDVDSIFWKKHHDSSFKILAIGNSFTINASAHMPWLINTLNSDSICFATLTQSGCSLNMHWANHTELSLDYDLYYSNDGHWTRSEIKNIDMALVFFDWDVIVFQQASVLAGIYSSYKPAFDNLVRLFRETNPSASIAWHYTWAYTAEAKVADFKKYDRDPGKMYDAIMRVCDRISEGLELSISSATLIKQMREAFPGVENGFSDDGIHITDNFAQYSLSSLWYETLIAPVAGSSSLDLTSYPPSVETEGMEKVKEIIESQILDK